MLKPFLLIIAQGKPGKINISFCRYALHQLAGGIELIQYSLSVYVILDLDKIKLKAAVCGAVLIFSRQQKIHFSRQQKKLYLPVRHTT